MHRSHVIAAVAIGAGILPAAARAQPPTADPVVTWNRELLSILRTPGAQPATVHPTRSMALLHAAIADAVTAIDGSAPPWLAAVRGPRTASRVAAIDVAAHDVLTALYPAMTTRLDEVEAHALSSTPGGARRTQGIAVGRRVARRALAARADDGAGVVPPAFTALDEPGAYRPTPPAFAAPAFTHWGAVRPFVVRPGDQLRPPAPPLPESAAARDALAEVASVGSATSTTRTADETLAARFWSGPIQNYVNEIAQGAVIASRADLDTSAQTFAALDVTLADATIAMYGAKYASRVWRPVTAIRATTDPGWTPLLTTPNDPSYPGAHSVLGAAGASVLATAFGDRFPVTVTSEVVPGTERRFASFTDAVREAGRARTWGGVHTSLDDASGQALGREVTRYVRRLRMHVR
jgi:PAP2 superfamily